MKQYIRLPLENAYNVRDLGGYAAADGVTRFGVFLRADDLTALSRRDIDFLIQYGVRTVIDLRSDHEKEAMPDPFAALDDAQYVSIPLMFDDIADVTRVVFDTPGSAMSDFYLHLLSNESHLIRQVLETIAAAEGAVLFHCAGGKDRTGMIAMLLLGLSGVAPADIVANYQVSKTYLNANPLYVKGSQGIAAELLASEPSYITRALQYIEKAGGFLPYLRGASLDSASIEAIRSRFIERTT